LLGLITFAIYSPVVNNEFVNYDDSEYVAANPHVQGLSWKNIVWAFTTGHASNWHPLTWLSHMLDWQWFGNRPAAHHLVSVAFHVANAILVFLVLRRMTGAHWRSAFVAALFAWHPLHVESVAWASERKDVLSALFFLLTLMSYARYLGLGSSRYRPAGEVLFGIREESPTDDQSLLTSAATRDWKWYGFALFFFGLGLMSKPMLVTTPFVLLLLDYWPLRRFNLPTIHQSTNPSSQSNNPLIHTVGVPLRSLLLEKVPFLVLSVASCVITFLVQRKGGAVSTSISVGARIANAVVAYVRYLGDCFWPSKLSVLYPHPGHWPAWEVGGAALVLIGISVFVGWSIQKRRYLMVGWCWFVGMLVPTIGLVQVGVQSMADRYTYLPVIGLFVIVAWGVSDLMAARTESLKSKVQSLKSNADESRPEVQRPKSILLRQKHSGGQEVQRPRSKKTPAHDEAKNTSEGETHAIPTANGPLVAAAGFVLLACAILTVKQIGYWQNSETLFRHAVQVTQSNYLAYNNLGFFLSNKGNSAEAMENYVKALEINPAYEDAHNNVGYALAGRKQYAEAIAHYEAALKIRPNHTEVHNNLGNALADTGQIDQAIEHYLIVLKQNPEHADAHNNLGIALAMKGHFDEAIEHFHAALRLKPDYASAHSNLGNAYAVQHKLDEAIHEYQESLRLNPKDPQAHNNLANALSEQGRLDEATAQYQEALRLNSENPEANYNLGLALIRQGKVAEAITHFQEALRLKPDYAEARKQLLEATQH
jgi:tetratricopeptide (TPR) repeat protein